jgi:hypothetical protein
LSFSVLLLLSVGATYGAELEPESKPTDSDTSLPSLNEAEPYPTPTVQNFAAAWAKMRNLVKNLYERVKTLSYNLTQSNDTLSKSESSRLAEREASDKALKTAEASMQAEAGRANRAEAELSFWRVGGITMAVFGVVAMVVGFIW